MTATLPSDRDPRHSHRAAMQHAQPTRHRTRLGNPALLNRHTNTTAHNDCGHKAHRTHPRRRGRGEHLHPAGLLRPPLGRLAVPLHPGLTGSPGTLAAETRPRSPSTLIRWGWISHRSRRKRALLNCLSRYSFRASPLRAAACVPCAIRRCPIPVTSTKTDEYRHLPLMPYKRVAPEQVATQPRAGQHPTGFANDVVVGRPGGAVIETGRGTRRPLFLSQPIARFR